MREQSFILVPPGLIRKICNCPVTECVSWPIVTVTSVRKVGMPLTFITEVMVVLSFIIRGGSAEKKVWFCAFAMLVIHSSSETIAGIISEMRIFIFGPVVLCSFINV